MVLIVAVVLLASGFSRHLVQLGREWDYADLARALEVQALISGELGSGPEIHGTSATQGPLFSLILAPFYLALGGVQGPFAGMNFLALLAILLTFVAAGKLFGNATSRLTFFLLALTPWGLSLGTDVSNNEAAAPFVVLAALGVLKFARKPGWGWWIVALAAITLTWQMALSGLLAVAGIMLGAFMVKRKALSLPHIIVGAAFLAANAALSLLWAHGTDGGAGLSLELHDPRQNFIALSSTTAGLVPIATVLALWALIVGRPKRGRQGSAELMSCALWILIPLAYNLFFEPPERVHYLFCSLPAAAMLLGLMLSSAWLPVAGAAKPITYVMRGAQAAGITLLTAASLTMPSAAGALGIDPVPPFSLVERQRLYDAVLVNLGADAFADPYSPPALRGWGSFNQALFLHRTLSLQDAEGSTPNEPGCLFLHKRGERESLSWDCRESELLVSSPALHVHRYFKLPLQRRLHRGNPCFRFYIESPLATTEATVELVMPAGTQARLLLEKNGETRELVEYESGEQFRQFYFSDTLMPAGDAYFFRVCADDLQEQEEVELRLDVF